MRFEEAVRRLEPLPDVLPEGPEALIPVFADTGSSRPRPAWGEADASARPAAVLVLVFPDEDGDARLVLTERVDRGGHHSGEVSFPGGSAEAGDADLVATALREAAEEVGLDPVQAGVRVLGVLEMQWIPVSNFTVTPVVAVADRRPLLTPQPTEVALILEPPVAAFLPDGELRIVEREIRGWQLRYAAYPVGELNVWGMTARVLGGLGAWLARRRRRGRSALERLAFLGVRVDGVRLRVDGSRRQPALALRGSRRRGSVARPDRAHGALDHARAQQLGRDRELDDDRAHRRPVGPGGVEHVGRPDHGLARLDPRPLVADPDPAAALDHEEVATSWGSCGG